MKQRQGGNALVKREPDNGVAADNRQKRVFIQLGNIDTGGKIGHWTRSAAGVMISIARTALCTVTVYVQNYATNAVIWYLRDVTTGYNSQQFTTAPGTTSDVYTFPQVVVKAGDKCSIMYH